MGGLQYEVEYIRLRRCQGSQAQPEPTMETGHTHVQQVRFHINVLPNFFNILLIILHSFT